MATYRQIYISFWQDPFVLSLTPVEKYFYLYLLTNSKTTLCGIYELPLRIAEFETGCGGEEVERMLQKFETCGKIKYSPETNEVCIRNWIKYNANRSPKVRAAVSDNLRAVKDTQLIPYLYSIHTLSSVSVSVSVPDSVPDSVPVPVSESVSVSGATNPQDDSPKNEKSNSQAPQTTPAPLENFPRKTQKKTEIISQMRSPFRQTHHIQ